jgi:hypothetical protein
MAEERGSRRELSIGDSAGKGERRCARDFLGLLLNMYW